MACNTCRLQPPDDTIADTNEDGVAIIDSTMYKGMDKFMSSIKRQRSTDGPQLLNLVETATYDTIHVILHPQLRIKDNAKVTHSIKWKHIDTTNTSWYLVYFRQYCGEPSQINCVLSAFNLSLTRVALPTPTLKSVINDLVPFMTELVNRSPTTGYVRDVFKAAYISTSLKKVDLNSLDVRSYRPISNLSLE